MGSAFHRMDIVGVGKNRLMKGVGPLQRDFDVDSFAHALEKDYVVERRTALADRLDEFGDTAFVVKFLFFTDAFVLEPDFEASVKIGHLAQITRDNLVLEDDFLEDRRVGRKGGFGAGNFGCAALLNLVLRCATFVILKKNFAVLAYFDFELRAQCVDDGGADAVQPARYFVGAAIELAARVQHRMHYFESVAFFGRMRPDRNTAAVILNRNPIVAQNHDVDFGTVTRKRFIDGVIDDLRNQMMESTFGGIADIHSRSFSNRLEPFENADRIGAVAIGTLFVCHRKRRS